MENENGQKKMSPPPLHHTGTMLPVATPRKIFNWKGFRGITTFNKIMSYEIRIV